MLVEIVMMADGELLDVLVGFVFVGRSLGEEAPFVIYLVLPGFGTSARCQIQLHVTHFQYRGDHEDRRRLQIAIKYLTTTL